MSIEITLIDFLREIESIAKQSRERIESESSTPHWARERMNLLGAIYNSPNRKLPREEFYRVGEDNGYSHQGLGGLFRHPPKLRYDSNYEYVELTDFGEQELFELRRRYA